MGLKKKNNYELLLDIRRTTESTSGYAILRMIFTIEELDVISRLIARALMKEVD
jgi:hypothetical protein